MDTKIVIIVLAALMVAVPLAISQPLPVNKLPYDIKAITSQVVDGELWVCYEVYEGQEFMYVLEGRIELFLGEKRYILKKGDAGYWNGSIPHMGFRLGKKPAKTLNVHLIPGMRVGTFETTD